MTQRINDLRNNAYKMPDASNAYDEYKNLNAQLKTTVDKRKELEEELSKLDDQMAEHNKNINKFVENSDELIELRKNGRK